MTILEKVQAILAEKTNKITAGNLKSGVTAFGVTGNLVELNPINGIIEQYLASVGTINANTFVEFVNDVELSDEPYSFGPSMALLLDTNKVFVTHSDGDGKLYAMVCTISGTTIFPGTSVKISNTEGAASATRVILVDTNTVLVTHGIDYSKVYGIVCTISGTTITPGEDTLIANNNTNPESSVVLLDTNKVFVLHQGQSNRLYGIICTISGNAIIPDTDTELVNASSSANAMGCVMIGAGKVFIVHSDSQYKANAMVCTISGTTITPGTSVKLSDEQYSSSGTNAVLVDTDKVFVTHSGVDGKLTGIVCTISGTTITPGTSTELSDKEYSYGSANALLIDTNKLFITHSGNRAINVVLCTISGTTIIPGEDTKLIELIGGDPSSYASLVLLDTNKVFMTHSGGSDNTANAIIYTISGENIEVSSTIKPAEKTINGITKTQCSSSVAGDVIVLAPTV